MNLTEARAQSQNIVYSTLHDEVVVLRAEVERQQGWIRDLLGHIGRLEDQLDGDAWDAINVELEAANDCIERQLADLETLRAAHDGTSVVLRAEVERQRIELWDLVADLERADDCIERQQADLETLRAARDGTSVDWRTR